jgi:cytidyltransferase-like protein
MKVGFNCSSFDLLHAGHVTMLKMEKELCDYLIVATKKEFIMYVTLGTAMLKRFQQ